MKAYFIAFTLLFMTALAAAEPGPWAPPCLGCPQFTRPPYPHTGLWFNPERPGTGINIDVQNGIMSAIYYGYREDGSAVWLLASGRLELAEASDVYWELETDLLEAVGGRPIGSGPAEGPHVEPQMLTAGTLHIEILQRNLLRFRINDGASEQMMPMMFGSQISNFFPEGSNFRLPNWEEGRELDEETPGGQTAWVIVQTNPQGDQFWELGRMTPLPQSGFAGYSESQRLLRYHFVFYGSIVSPTVSGTITCGRIDDLAEQYSNSMAGWSGEEPICTAISFGGDGKRYFMPLGNMGDRRFSAVAEDGSVMEGFRLLYD